MNRKEDLSLSVAMPLDSAREGQWVRIVSIDGGRGLVTRLLAMGLLPGTPVLVMRNRGRGPCLLAVRNSRIAIGRGMAHKIRVV